MKDCDNLPAQCHPRLEKKQVCGYCPENKCLLDCKICNPNVYEDCNC